MDCFTPEKPFRFVGCITSELPNDNLKEFRGSLKYDKEAETIGIRQFLPSGAILKNTQWIIGLAVFTGDDTKLRQNSKQGKPKMSKIERLLNKYIVAVMLFQFCLCLIAAIAGGVWA
jgi:magnesium-transporting ATPase (P-type)